MDIARDDVISRLRPAVRDQLTLIEHAIGLKVRFARLPRTSQVDPTYTFNPHKDTPKMPPFSRVVKSQNSSKTHLFQEPEKHPDFQVTSCYHFVSTNVNYAYIESE